ncbi:MAG TPA: YggT family protein [Anaerolineae bacterium]|nr:YggT family protein [Anaerolineae bacterium]HZQ10824.1 YggT family protein [Anaerolineae bacterium]
MIGQVLYTTVEIFFNIVLLLILVRIILSWLPQLRYNQIAEIVFGITEPILSPFQRIIPPIGMIDISPMVAIIALSVLQQVLLWLIVNAFELPIQ